MTKATATKKTAEQEEQEYEDAMVAAFDVARAIFVNVFNFAPSREQLDLVFDNLIDLDEDNKVDVELAQESEAQLRRARVFAKRIYDDDGVAATFGAYLKMYPDSLESVVESIHGIVLGIAEELEVEVE